MVRLGAGSSSSRSLAGGNSFSNRMFPICCGELMLNRSPASLYTSSSTLPNSWLMRSDIRRSSLVSTIMPLVCISTSAGINGSSISIEECLVRRLVLVKHSMPEIEPGRPASAWRLGEVGRRRSEALAARLRDFSPDVIWSSRELKAVETADIVAGVLGVPVGIADGLEEHHRSNAPYFPTMDEFESAVEQLFCNPDQLVLGTETAGQASGTACRIRRRGKAGRRCWKDRAATPPSIRPTALEWSCAGCSC